ncbi:helix-turn-helix domain-containing protein [Priestia megaterium]
MKEYSEKLLSLNETAKLLGMGKSTLSKKLKAFAVKGVSKKDNRILISPSSIPQLKTLLEYNDKFDEKVYFSTDQVARIFNEKGLTVKRTDVSNWIKAGKVENISHMGYRYIHQEDLAKLIKKITYERSIPEGFCSTDEAAEILEMFPDTIKSWALQGDIESKRIIVDSYWRIFVKRDSLEEVRKKKRRNMLKNFPQIDDSIIKKSIETMNKNKVKITNDINDVQDFLTFKEALEILKVKKGSLEDYLKRGKFPSAIKLKNKWYIDPQDIAAYSEKEWMTQKGYLKTSEIVQQLNINSSSVLKLISRGTFPSAKKVNGRWYIKKEEVDTYKHSKPSDIPQKRNDAPQEETECLKTSEIVQRLNINSSSVLKLISRGTFPSAKKVNGRWYVKKEEIDTYEQYKLSITKEIKVPEDYLTLDEVAQELNIRPSGVRSLIKKKKLIDAKRYNKNWFIPENSLIEYKRKKLQSQISVTKPGMISDLTQLIENTEGKEHLKETFRLYTDFSTIKLKATQGRIDNIRRVFNTLRRLFSKVLVNLEVEIYELPESSIELITKNESFSNPIREFFLHFLEHCFLIKGRRLDNKQYLFSRKAKKAEKDVSLERYPPEIYQLFEKHVKDIEQHIDFAVDNRKYANMWGLTTMLLTNAWRPSDIIFEMPRIEIEFIGDLTFIWFQENRLTLEQCQLIVNQLYLKLNNSKASKNKANLNFLVAPDMVEPLAYACVISELHCRSLNNRSSESQRLLLGTFLTKVTASPITSGDINHHIFFKTESKLLPFSSRKLHNSTMTYIFLDISEDEEESELALEITGWTRSHKDLNVTAGYIKLTNSDASLDRVSINLFRRGHFGWLYNYMVQLVLRNRDIHQTLEERTLTIAELRTEYSPIELEGWANTLLNYKNEAESIVRRLYKMSKEELKLIIEKIYRGQMPSRDGCGQCLTFPNCNLRHRKTCIGCIEFIPQLQQVLIEAKEEFNRLINSLKNSNTEAIQIRDTLFLFNVLTLFNEAANTFSKDLIDGFLNVEERERALYSIADKLQLSKV